MAWTPTPTPDRRDENEVVVDDGPTVVDDIEIIDEPRVIADSVEVIQLDPSTVPAPGPTKVRTDADEAKAWAALLGPEAIAGVSLVALFVIFAIVLTGGAPEEERDLEGNPIPQIELEEPPDVAPEAPIEVEIGEALTVDRGE